jgi:hypothetical protein
MSYVIHTDNMYFYTWTIVWRLTPAIVYNLQIKFLVAGREGLQRSGNTVFLAFTYEPGGHTSLHSPTILPPPSPGEVGGGGKVRIRGTVKQIKRRPRSTLKIHRINNKVEWKVKYASLSYFTG